MCIIKYIINTVKSGDNGVPNLFWILRHCPLFTYAVEGVLGTWQSALLSRYKSKNMKEESYEYIYYF